MHEVRSGSGFRLNDDRSIKLSPVGQCLAGPTVAQLEFLFRSRLTVWELRAIYVVS